ncbi:MAG: NAD-dependent epimerase/dehydratase family protein [Paracoccus sp. (in: a-proteobacteria)]
MKVLVIGGYGVFGSRLARLLLRDGHRVTIAGRDIGAGHASRRAGWAVKPCRLTVAAI